MLEKSDKEILLKIRLCIIQNKQNNFNFRLFAVKKKHRQKLVKIALKWNVGFQRQCTALASKWLYLIVLGDG